MKYAEKGLFVALFVLYLVVAIDIMDYIKIVNVGYQVSNIRMKIKHPPEATIDENNCTLLQRVCGSPAAQGYSKVDPECLAHSPTTVAYLHFLNSSSAIGNPPEWISVVMNETDIDGLAVQWGIGNKQFSAQGCKQACINYKPKGFGGMDSSPYKLLPCNAWVWCPEDVCWEPDAHSHTKGDCWLKFTEAPHIPEVNMRGVIDLAVKSKHKEAPDLVPWVSGVLLLPGMHMTNGTWSPRAAW